MEEGDKVLFQTKLLGRFEMWREGRLLKTKAWPQRKTQTLLEVLLAERGQVFTQGQLIDALFPDLDGDKARTAYTLESVGLVALLKGATSEPSNGLRRASGGLRKYPMHG